MTTDEKYKIFQQFVGGSTIQSIAETSGLSTTTCTKYLNEFRGKSFKDVNGLSKDYAAQFELLSLLMELYDEKVAFNTYIKYNEAGVYVLDDLNYKVCNSLTIPRNEVTTLLRLIPFHRIKQLRDYKQLQSYSVLYDSVIKRLSEDFSCSSYYELYMREDEVKASLIKYKKDLIVKMDDYNSDGMFRSNLSSCYSKFSKMLGNKLLKVQLTRLFLILECFIPGFDPDNFKVCDIPEEYLSSVVHALSKYVTLPDGKKLTMTALKKVKSSSRILLTDCVFNTERI